jgi:hypothetical protein
MSVTGPTTQVHIVLVTCVKSKRDSTGGSANGASPGELRPRTRGPVSSGTWCQAGAAKGHDRYDFFKFFERACVR